VTPLYAARSPLVAARELGGEMIIMSAADSTLFTLNEVATAIWKAADGVTPLREIIEQKVCAEYDVVPAVAVADAESFVQELASHGILLISEKPILGSSSVNPRRTP
jgi:hypothetical protein